MYFSNRERMIIRYLLEQRKGITIDLLSKKLDVSKRTIYREMSSLEDSLAKINIKLERDKEGYSLEGKWIFFDELEDMLDDTSTDLTPTQRQSMIVIQLLFESNEMKMETLANELKVSVGTIQSDLQMIDEMFEPYGIRVERQKAKGILAEANELNRRLIITGLISSEINEYDFFKFFKQDGKLEEATFDTIQQPFIECLDIQNLIRVYSIISKLTKFDFQGVSDTQFQRFIILIAVTVERLKSGYFITPEQLSQKQADMSKGVSDETFDVEEELTAELKSFFDIELSESEKNFLLQYIETLNDPIKSEFAEDYNVNFGYKVRRLIQLVSKDMGWNFNQDETLFTDLLAHINASVKQTNTRMPESHNPLLEKIYDEYTELSESVQRHLKGIFPKVNFLKNEELYVVIHLASAYERISKTQKLSVLIICSSGLGTGKMLESRLRKYLPESSRITISRITQLEGLIYSDYDMILSTIFLQGFEAEYKVVSPLLMSDEINSIKAYTKEVLIKKQGNQKLESQFSLEDRKVKDEFQNFYKYLTIANNIINYFDFISVSKKSTIRQALIEASEQLEGIILDEPKQVVAKLEKRMELAPIGLPQTNMALFHTTDESIIEPFFGIVELGEQQSVLAMDSEAIVLKRIILMLAPEPLTAQVQDILGTISSSIVESNLNMEIFNSGNKELITNFLSNLFLEEVKS